jgi:hypothetical protein
MHFADLLTDRDLRQALEVALAGAAKFVEDCARFVADAAQVVAQATSPQKKLHYATIYLLMRHVVEAVDGVGILVAKGSVDNCGPLLRSALEAMVGLIYITFDDAERRALAYEVAHIHRRIKSYRRLIPTDDVGRAMREELKGEELHGFFDRPAMDWKKKIDNLRGLLKRPEYAPIEAEWQRARKGKAGYERKSDPEWYSLFGGPAHLRDLCLRIGHGGYYEILYRGWATFAHAGGGFDSVRWKEGVGPAIRPVRFPENVERPCGLAYLFCLQTVATVMKALAPTELPTFRARVKSQLGPRMKELLRDKVLLQLRHDPSATHGAGATAEQAAPSAS